MQFAFRVGGRPLCRFIQCTALLGSRISIFVVAGSVVDRIIKDITVIRQVIFLLLFLALVRATQKPPLRKDVVHALRLLLQQSLHGLGRRIRAAVVANPGGLGEGAIEPVLLHRLLDCTVEIFEESVDVPEPPGHDVDAYFCS